jgi:hypothetical protein
MTKEEKDNLLESIIVRKENEFSFWSRKDWDYTEWEEAYDEFRNKVKLNEN